MKRLLAIFCVIALVVTMFPLTVFAAETGSVDFAVLSTTDMHGKCWDKNVLTEGTENNNMLRVSTAVKQYRDNYGENLLVVDNGDLYQGTPVSVVQLGKITSGESDLPAAMALCLAEIGYDMAVLGNHEFNYPWSTMSGIYDYLASRGVPTVTANLYYDGTDGVHEKGENVFTPYLVKTFKIGATEHKIGILGFENTDCTRWDVPDNYPGILFAHPDNPQRSIAWEAQRYIPMMQAEGCEFIIVSYHSGTGSTTGTLTFGVNTEGQVSRMIAECEDIDMVIAGHDHSSSYSNTYLNDKNGDKVLVVNGGGQQLTQSVFTFSEDAEGKLTYTVKETKNLAIGNYAVDADLKAKLQPYADMATEYVNQTAGTAVGTWDTSYNYYLQQTDTMDLINGAQIDYGTKYLAKKYDTDEKKAALFEATGLDHIDVDMSSTSAVTNNNYYVRPGPITMKTIVQMYKYDNNVLYLLPLTGQQIKNILEQNASTRLKATVRNGVVSYSTIGENFTNPVFGGLNFVYDMYQPEGSRAVIEGFSNGREFALDKTYIVACNSYHLGNPGCGFGAYATTDSIWNQNDDLAGGNVQETLLEYIQDKGEVSPDLYTWEWKLDYTGDLDAPTTLKGDYVAQKADGVADGDQIVIYYDAESTVIGKDPAADDRRLDAVDTVMVGDKISFTDKAAVFTVETVEGENNPFLLKAEAGYLTAGDTGNSLGFAETPTDCSKWYLAETTGGYHIMNVGAAYNGNHNQALEWYTGFTTYGVKDTSAYLFNIYKLVDTAKLAGELKDGGKYVIYFDQDELCLDENLGGVKNDVSGDFMMLPLAEGTRVFTAHINDENQIDFVSEDGRHLTSKLGGNGLSLTDELDPDGCSLWTLVAVNGGWHVMNVGANYNGNHNQALEYYNGKFTTYGVKDTGAYLFNFYELTEAGAPSEDQPIELVDIGNIWTGFDLVNPMAFTAELNPAEPQLAEQMEIAEETWVNEADDTVYCLSDGEAVAMPTPGTYHYSITLRAKDGYVFGEAFRFIYGGTEQDLSGMVVMRAEDGKELTLSGFVPAKTVLPAALTKVALIADAGGPEDGGFNQQVHEAAKAWCEAHEAEYAAYTFEDSYNTEVENYGVGIVEQAISEGATVLLLPGFSFTEPTAKTCASHPDVTYILLDVDEYALLDAMGDPDGSIPANVYLATYREEQSGFLAGYAAVAMGYNKLGFLGGPEFPGITRFGYGFVQGANAAASALGREDEVEVKFVYTGQFMPDAEMTEFVKGWYEDGVEVVFACGGGIYASAAEAAAAKGGKLIGVDADQKEQIDGEFGEGITVTSAVKNMGATVVLQLDALLRGSFEGGREEKNGIVSAVPGENPVCLAASTVYNDSFTEEDAIALLERIVSGELTVSDETEEKPETGITVIYQCYTACDWGEPTYEWAADNSTVTATRVCKNDETHVETETVETSLLAATPATCTESGEGTYTATFENEAFETQTKPVELKPIGHDWGEPTYEWAADNATVSASVQCKRDESHVRNEVAVVQTWISKQPTYEEEGERSYIAYFLIDPFETQTKTEPIPKVEKPVTPTPTPVENPFKDVGENDWFKDAVLWAVSQTPAITNGTDATHFSPTKTCTRAEVVQFLWNAAGQPAVDGAANPFVDVKATDWFYKSVMWAVANGITNGTDASHFAPAKKCTRAEVVTFLRNAASDKEVTTTDNPFSDVKSSDWFFSSVLWAVERKITSGTTPTTFAPTKTCTRAEVVQFLYKATPQTPAGGDDEPDYPTEPEPKPEPPAALEITPEDLDDVLWLLDRINQDRVAAGLQPLAFSRMCYDCAKLRASEISEVYAISRPDGSDWYLIFEELGYEQPKFAGQLINRRSVARWSNEGNYQQIAESSHYTDTAFLPYFKYAAICFAPAEYEGKHVITTTIIFAS